MIRAVTFDFWQTLVGEPPGHMRGLQIDQFAATLKEFGYAVSAQALSAAFQANWSYFEERWRANEGQHTPAGSVDLICRKLEIDPSTELRERLVDGFRLVGESAHLELAPNVEACLKALRAAGLPCGIVCDVGLTSAPTLRARLRRFGLLQYFQAWAFSDETGWFKPSAQAFWPALNKLGTSDPSESAHVGDNPRTDIAGAKALGMLSVRYVGLARRSPYDSHGDEGPEADHVIEDFAQLPAVLGV